MNRDVVAWLYFCREPDDVPVGKTNAAMAGGTTDRIGTVRAVNADSFFVECDPYHPNWVARTWRKQIEIAATLAVMEHLLVVTESRHVRDPAHFAFADRTPRVCQFVDDICMSE